MKNIILKTIETVLIGVICAILLLISYYLFIDIQSKPVEKIVKNFKIEEKEFIGRKVFSISPNKQVETTKKIIYFHGGAYIAEITEKHWEFLGQIVNDTGVTIIVPDYPLIPKYTHKDVFNMVMPLYKEIIDKINPDDLIIMGDSAGGGIGLALIEKINEEKLEKPSKTILISPWLDVRLENPQIEEVQKRDKQLNKDTLKLAGIAYAGEDGINSYLVNPLIGNLSNLKNITIFTGKNDILNPDVNVLKQKAKEVGTEIEIKEYENAGHIWMIEKNSDEELTKKGYQEIISTINN